MTQDRREDEAPEASEGADSGDGAASRAPDGVGTAAGGRSSAAAEASSVAGGESPGSGSRSSLPAERLQDVIRRAAEIQLGEGEGPREALSGEEIVRIGTEVGLEPRHVRRALAEVRAESLLPEPPEDRGLARGMWGPAVARASRAVPGAPRDVQGRVEEHFRSRESLQSVRRRAGRSLWEPAGSLVSKMQRTLDVGGRGYELAEARRLELSVAELEEGWSLVTLTVDLRNVRAEHGVAWSAGSAGGAVGATVVAVAAVGVPLIAAVSAVAAAAVGASALGGRWTLERKRERLELVLQGLLDRLEQGEELEPRRPDWRERLLS